MLFLPKATQQKNSFRYAHVNYAFCQNELPQCDTPESDSIVVILIEIQVVFSMTSLSGRKCLRRTTTFPARCLPSATQITTLWLGDYISEHERTLEAARAELRDLIRPHLPQ